MKILYLGGVGPFGGASRSLHEVVRALPRDEVEGHFLMPRGTALDFYRRVAVDTMAVSGISRLDHTRDGHYRGMRWLITGREIRNIAPTLTGLRAAHRKWPDIDLIHVNEITEIVPALLAKRMWKVPLVVHVRALMHTDRGLLRTRWVHRMLAKADAIVAIDETVRARLPADLPVDVIHNSFTAEPIETPDAAYLARLDGLRSDSFKVGFVGNFIRNKGLVELIEAARLVRSAGGNVEFVIVGGGLGGPEGWKARALKAVGLSQNVEAQVRAIIAEHGLEGTVHLLGPTADIQRVYPRMDVLAFPSQLDAPGRPVFEAAFYGVPSIVAVEHPTPDTLRDGETGLAIRGPDPKLIADAILRCDRDRADVKRMGANAKALAESNFRPEVNAGKLLALYKRVLAC